GAHGGNHKVHDHGMNVHSAASGGAGAEPAVGAIQAFERLVKGAARADALESYARYLAVTGGDAEDAHQARDLAERAAEAEPSAPRLLLAAELAEDRNGRRVLLDRAEPLATTPADRVAFLLAKAQLVRSGPNWRDAVPIY